MLLNVIDIPITGKEFSAKIAKQKLDLDIPLVEPVYIRGKASKSLADVFIRASLQAKIKGDCARCLETFVLSIETGVELVYQPAPENETHDELEEIDTEELGVLRYKDSVIDLIPAIRDTILLEIPIKMLCDDYCKGLCVQCGTNLNKKTCSCEQGREEYNPFRDFFQKR